MDSKICPSCNVENNPKFNQCWKCGLVFSTGEKLPLQKAGRNQLWWPEMTSLANAKQATENAFGAAMFSAAITAILSLLPLFGKSILGFTIINFADVFPIVALGFGVKRKSRVSAILLLVYFIVGKIVFMTETAGMSGSNFISGVIWGLFYVNGARGTFAYHKFNKTVINRKNVILKTIMALIYGGVVWFLSIVLLVLIQSNPSNNAYSLTIIPAVIIVWFSYSGWLPFTKKSIVVKNGCQDSVNGQT